MIKRMSIIFTRMTNNYLPDAYIFAIILTFITFVAGFTTQDRSVMQMVMYWGDGLWTLLGFSMQMALVLVFGFTLAKTYVVHNFLRKVASLAKNQAQASILLTLVSCGACYLNWGFGLIVSALLAVQIARQLREVNYGLLIANAYSGFLVWHGGLSGSIPLKLTNPSVELMKLMNHGGYKLSDTIFSNLNLIILFVTVIVLLVVNYLMAKYTKNKKVLSFEEITFDLSKKKGETFAQKLEHSRLLNFTLITLGMMYLFSKIMTSGFDLNLVIFLFMLLALIFHGTSKSFLEAFNDSVKDSSGILLQFPFYAGIMSMMAKSGMALKLSAFFANISTKETFLFFTYISAGVVNFFVPSGGGQWVLQAPIIIPAAHDFNIAFNDAAMAIAWGDAWTNMVQPFWALPLLSAANCSLKEMMTYSVLIFLSVGLSTGLIFLLY